MFTVQQTEAFVLWLDTLADKRAQVRIAARLRQVETGNLGDWQPVQAKSQSSGFTSGLGIASVSFAEGELSWSC